MADPSSSTQGTHAHKRDGHRRFLSLVLHKNPLRHSASNSPTSPSAAASTLPDGQPSQDEAISGAQAELIEKLIHLPDEQLDFFRQECQKLKDMVSEPVVTNVQQLTLQISQTQPSGGLDQSSAPAHWADVGLHQPTAVRPLQASAFLPAGPGSDIESAIQDPSMGTLRFRIKDPRTAGASEIFEYGITDAEGEEMVRYLSDKSWAGKSTWGQLSAIARKTSAELYSYNDPFKSSKAERYVLESDPSGANLLHVVVDVEPSQQAQTLSEPLSQLSFSLGVPENRFSDFVAECISVVAGLYLTRDV